ncbi:MAG: hypothetical protein J0H84_25685 [Rhizobiales bacterium]|jgi:hypothetical protein|nr:hypothetical protein [Hyphomicrobiales bacterium]
MHSPIDATLGPIRRLPFKAEWLYTFARRMAMLSARDSERGNRVIRNSFHTRRPSVMPQRRMGGSVLTGKFK